MTFHAKYDGHCAGCPERIHPGDLVMSVDGEIVHADCDTPVIPERKTETCAVCWLIKPCPCEEAS